MDADAAAPASPPRPLTMVATGSRGFCVLSAVESAGGGTLLAAVASEDSASVRVFDARRAELLCELSEAAAAAAARSVAEGGAGGAGREQQQQQQPRPPPSRGMAMAVSLFFAGGSDALHALVGYEDGSVVLWRCLGGAKGEGKRDGGDRDDDGARATTTTTGTTAAVAAAHPPPRALSSLRIHFDAVTAVVGTVTQDSAAGKRSLRFFSGGADSVLASYRGGVGGDDPPPRPPRSRRERRRGKQRRKRQNSASSLSLSFSSFPRASRGARASRRANSRPDVGRLGGAPGERRQGRVGRALGPRDSGVKKANKKTKRKNDEKSSFFFTLSQTFLK